jgi:hypothetical protein
MIFQHALHPGGVKPSTQDGVDGSMTWTAKWSDLATTVLPSPSPDKAERGWTNPRQSSRWRIEVAGEMSWAGGRGSGPMRGPQVPWRERESRGRPHAGVCSTAGQVPHAWDCVLGPAPVGGHRLVRSPGPMCWPYRTPYLCRPQLTIILQPLGRWAGRWFLRLRFWLGSERQGKNHTIPHYMWIQGCISV